MNKNKLSFNDFTFIDLKQVHSIILHSWKMFFLIILFSIFTGYFSVQTFFQSTITTYTIKNNNTNVIGLMNDLSVLSSGINTDLIESKRFVQSFWGSDINIPQQNILRNSKSDDISYEQTEKNFIDPLVLNTYINVTKNKQLIIEELINEKANILFSSKIINKEKFIKNFVNRTSVFKNNNTTYEIRVYGEHLKDGKILSNWFFKKIHEIFLRQISYKFLDMDSLIDQKKSSLQNLIKSKLLIIKDYFSNNTNTQLAELELEKKIIEVELKYSKIKYEQLGIKKNNLLERQIDLKKESEIVELKIKNVDLNKYNNKSDINHINTLFQEKMLKNVSEDHIFFKQKVKKLKKLLIYLNYSFLHESKASKLLRNNILIIFIFALGGASLGFAYCYIRYFNFKIK